MNFRVSGKVKKPMNNIALIYFTLGNFSGFIAISFENP
jgi:hypothetical protein